MSATTLLPTEAELVEELFKEFRKEYRLEGASEITIGRELAANELWRRRIMDYDSHRFEVAEASAALETADRLFRKQFEEVFARGNNIFFSPLNWI